MTDGSGGGRLAIVTGSSSGIGRQTALALARRGYRTVLVARRQELLEELATRLSRYAPSTPMVLDMADVESVKAGFAALTKRLGTADILVNCAGHGMYERFLDCPEENHHQLMRVHYFAALTAIREVLPGMVARSRGHIINVGSMSAKMGPWGHSGYAAAKAALTALTESLSAEYGPSGVRFSVVHPGIVDTPYYQGSGFAPLRERTRRWLIGPDRVARAVTGLVDRPRLSVCVPRHYRVLDVVAAVSPSLLGRLIAYQSTPPQDASRPHGVPVATHPSPVRTGGPAHRGGRPVSPERREREAGHASRGGA